MSKEQENKAKEIKEAKEKAEKRKEAYDQYDDIPDTICSPEFPEGCMDVGGINDLDDLFED